MQESKNDDGVVPRGGAIMEEPMSDCRSSNQCTTTMNKKRGRREYDSVGRTLLFSKICSFLCGKICFFFVWHGQTSSVGRVIGFG